MYSDLLFSCLFCIPFGSTCYVQGPGRAASERRHARRDAARARLQSVRAHCRIRHSHHGVPAFARLRPQRLQSRRQSQRRLWSFGFGRRGGGRRLRSHSALRHEPAPDGRPALQPDRWPASTHRFCRISSSIAFFLREKVFPFLMLIQLLVSS